MQTLERLMRKRVGAALLRAQREKSVVGAEQGPGQLVLWELAR